MLKSREAESIKQDIKGFHEFLISSNFNCSFNTWGHYQSTVTRFDRFENQRILFKRIRTPNTATSRERGVEGGHNQFKQFIPKCMSSLNWR